MAHLSFDASALKQFVHDNELGEIQAMVNAADTQLRAGTGAGPISAIGYTYQRNMTRKNLLGFKLLLSKSKVIRISW